MAAGPQGKHAALFYVTLQMTDGSMRTVSPYAIGNAGDSDNNHELCIDTQGSPVSVFFPVGHLFDPNHDVNSHSSVEIQN